MSAPASGSLHEFQAKEGLLFRVGYRLARANAEFCARQTASAGLLLHDARAYGEPAAVRATFGLRGDIGVQAVAEGSPAAMSGLRPNLTVVSIDGVTLSEIEIGDKRDWRRAAQIAAQLESSASDGSVTLAWLGEDGKPVERDIATVPICATRFELLSGKASASADGTRVLIGENFPGLAYPESELAAALAHEMAHNLLDHIPYLDEHGRGDGRVRATERDADRLMPWLLANAGYDPASAASFMRRWGPRHGGWIFRKRSHDGWDERVAFIEAELPVIARLQEDGRVDWKTHFEAFVAEPQ